LNELALSRGETLAQMALGWLLHDKRVTTVIVGASSVQQLKDNIGTLNMKGFSQSELDEISYIAGNV
jgi:L-glyceraldehyde 3-phosphate reductase